MFNCFGKFQLKTCDYGTFVRGICWSMEIVSASRPRRPHFGEKHTRFLHGIWPVALSFVFVFKFWNLDFCLVILKFSFLTCFGGAVASGVGSGYSQCLSGPPQVVSRTLEKIKFRKTWVERCKHFVVRHLFDLLVVFNSFHSLVVNKKTWFGTYKWPQAGPM